MPTNLNPVFFRFQDLTIRHVCRHQDITLDFIYLDPKTGHEFDVRELSDAALGSVHAAVSDGDRAAHRIAITRAIELGQDLSKRTAADSCDEPGAGADLAPVPVSLKTVKLAISNLQTIHDHGVVDQLIYGWLKQCGVSVPEEASEALSGSVSGLLSRARAGKDRPTLDEVRTQLEAGNRFGEMHNAQSWTTQKFPPVDLADLPDVYATAAATLYDEPSTDA